MRFKVIDIRGKYSMVGRYFCQKRHEAVRNGRYWLDTEVRKPALWAGLEEEGV